VGPITAQAAGNNNRIEKKREKKKKKGEGRRVFLNAFADQKAKGMYRDPDLTYIHERKRKGRKDKSREAGETSVPKNGKAGERFALSSNYSKKRGGKEKKKRGDKRDKYPVSSWRI